MHSGGTLGTSAGFNPWMPSTIMMWSGPRVTVAPFSRRPVLNTYRGSSVVRPAIRLSRFLLNSATSTASRHS